jgi:hypothetical protein
MQAHQPGLGRRGVIGGDGDVARRDDPARVAVVDAGQDLDERRLPRPVASDEGMDLAGQDVEGDVVERSGSGECLGQVIDAQGRRRGQTCVR